MDGEWGIQKQVPMPIKISGKFSSRFELCLAICLVGKGQGTVKDVTYQCYT